MESDSVDVLDANQLMIEGMFSKCLGQSLKNSLWNEVR